MPGIGHCGGTAGGRFERANVRRWPLYGASHHHLSFRFTPRVRGRPIHLEVVCIDPGFRSVVASWPRGRSLPQRSRDPPSSAGRAVRRALPAAATPVVESRDAHGRAALLLGMAVFSTNVAGAAARTKRPLRSSPGLRCRRKSGVHGLLVVQARGAGVAPDVAAAQATWPGCATRASSNRARSLHSWCARRQARGSDASQGTAVKAF